MSQAAPFRPLILAVFAWIILAGAAATNACADPAYLATITIYNKSNVTINYQLRAYRNGEWTDWSTQHHKHPNGGWHSHWYDDAEKIQIRFDRIGGDDEYTEKSYNLEFNRVDPGRDPGRHDGRPYYFQYDAGGSLLDLYRYGW